MIEWVRDQMLMAMLAMVSVLALGYFLRQGGHAEVHWWQVVLGYLLINAADWLARGKEVG